MKNYLIVGATAASGKVLSTILAENEDNKIILLSRSKSTELEKLAEQQNVKYFYGLD